MEIENVNLKELHEQLLATDSAYAEAAREVDAAQTLADRVVALRVAAGLTQAELAKKAGISQPRLSRLEAGIDNPTLDTLERVGDALGVRLDYAQPQMSLPLLTVATLQPIEAPGPFVSAGTFVGANFTFQTGVQGFFTTSVVMDTVADTSAEYVEAPNADFAEAA